MSLIPRSIGNLKLYVRKDKQEILEFFAHDISRKLKEFRSTPGTDVLFLSSGGSSFEVLDFIDEQVIGPYLTIGVIDEQYDRAEHISNYAALRKTKFFARAVQHGCRFIDTFMEKDQTQEGLADHYEHELRTWRVQHPRGVIMATMGIAIDGHTAGIIPCPQNPARFNELFESERWITFCAPSKQGHFLGRITPTFTFLRSVNMVGVYLIGEEKGAMFKELLAGDDVQVMSGRIIKTLPCGAVYTDAALARVAGLIE